MNLKQGSEMILRLSSSINLKIFSNEAPGHLLNVQYSASTVKPQRNPDFKKYF